MQLIDMEGMAVFLSFAVAVCILWCAIELLAVCLSSKTFNTLFLFQLMHFMGIFSLCAVNRLHQSTVAYSVEIQCGFWLQAECYLLLLYSLYYTNGPLF